MSPADFQDPYSGFQFGVPLSQIDVILAISAVTFDEAWADSVPGVVEGDIPVRYISREHLIQSKTAAGRLRDLADLDAILKAEKAYSPSKE